MTEAAQAFVVIKSLGLIRWAWQFDRPTTEHDWPEGRWELGQRGTRYAALEDARRDARRLTRDLPRDERYRYAQIQVWQADSDDRFTRLHAAFEVDIVDRLAS